MPCNTASFFSTVLKTSSLVSGISSSVRVFASLCEVSRMMWESAETLKASIERLARARGSRAHWHTCLVQQFSQPTGGPDSCAYLGPLEICDVLFEFEMFRKQLRYLGALLALKLPVFQHPRDVCDPEGCAGDIEQCWRSV